MSDEGDENEDKPKKQNSSELSEKTRKVLDGLTTDEAKVLRERFGISFDNNVSLEEIGNQFEVTRERIRQIEEKALRKIKNKKDLENTERCSFCNKSKNEVAKLIASQVNNVLICDECIEICQELINEEKGTDNRFVS